MPISTIDSKGLTSPLTSGVTTNTVTSAAATALTLQSAGTTAVTINTSQNVGIGTTSPNLGGLTRALTINTPTGGNYSGLELAGAGTLSARFVTNNVGTYVGSQLAIPLVFETSGAERVRINSGGQVSVGGNTPSGNFQFEVNNVAGTAASRGSILNTISLGQSGGDYPFVGYNFRTTTATLTYNYNANDTFFAHSYGNNARLAVYSASAGTAGNAISLSLGPYVTTNGTSWTTGSDERIKNITGTLTGALASIAQLRAVRYTLKDDPRNKSQIGFIAQDWQKDYPEVVDVPEHEVDPKTGDKLYLGIQYTETIPVLLAAIQELKTIVDAQAAEIAELKAKVA